MSSHKLCPVCDGPIAPRLRESRHELTKRIYCSKPCAFAAKRAATAARLDPATKTCEWCSVEFGPPEHERRRPARWATRRFCTVACGIAHREANRVRTAPGRRKPDTRRRRKPVPETSAFGDRKPVTVWRPAGFSPSPSVERKAS